MRALAHYAISYVAGALTVTPAPLTITADDKSKIYGAVLPTLTASYSGFVNGDTAASLTTAPTLSTTATASSHVSGSPYTITASGAVDVDYAISYVPGTLTFTTAPLTITADDKSKIYGAGVPTTARRKPATASSLHCWVTATGTTFSCSSCPADNTTTTPTGRPRRSYLVGFTDGCTVVPRRRS